ncbi:MAG: YueI family protein [Lactococcus plantarum]|nr:YueI family protein [Lactococcus plantarum]MDN6084860.1 YueI family protein [Lactococcus plantarum]
MNDLENRLERASSGEYRLNPDEQKHYLNTYRERVLLAINLADAQNLLLKPHFDAILSRFDNQDETVFVKVCGKLPDELSGYYLKLAADHHFEGQILAEADTDCFGIVIHTDHAVNQEKISLTDCFPDINLSDQSEQPEQPKKKSFFDKLFG